MSSQRGRRPSGSGTRRLDPGHEGNGEGEAGGTRGGFLGNLITGVAAGVAFGAVAAAGLYAYRNRSQPPVREEHPTQGRQQSSSMFRLPSISLGSFWKTVEKIADEEVKPSSIELEAETVPRFRNKYNKFDSSLRSLLANKIRIDEVQWRIYKESLNEVMVEFEKRMRSDAIFDFLFNRYSPAGSSWEDMKICCPDEYDLNLILMPVNMGKQFVEVVDLSSGHTGLRLPSGFSVPNNQAIQKKLNCLLDNEYFLSRTKVLSWFEGVVATAEDGLREHLWKTVQSIRIKKSGPAITICVVMKNSKDYTIDFVPCFEFSVENLPQEMLEKYNRIVKSATKRNWYAIPKGHTKSSSPKVWRTSMYAIERDLMNGKEQLKPTIRIMKSLRDNHDQWKAISSYYIKTAFMWMLEESEDWRISLGQAVMLALKKLQTMIMEGSIPYFWDPHHNLLDTTSVSEEQLKNIANRLQIIIKGFEKSIDDSSVDPMVYFGYSSRSFDMAGEAAVFSHHDRFMQRNEDYERVSQGCALM